MVPELDRLPQGQCAAPGGQGRPGRQHVRGPGHGAGPGDLGHLGGDARELCGLARAGDGAGVAAADGADGRVTTELADALANRLMFACGACWIDVCCVPPETPRMIPRVKPSAIGTARATAKRAALRLRWRLLGR